MLKLPYVYDWMSVDSCRQCPNLAFEPPMCWKWFSWKERKRLSVKRKMRNWGRSGFIMCPFEIYFSKYWFGEGFLKQIFLSPNLWFVVLEVNFLRVKTEMRSGGGKSQTLPIKFCFLFWHLPIKFFFFFWLNL
jgi:hypothetical protein